MSKTVHHTVYLMDMPFRSENLVAEAFESNKTMELSQNSKSALQARRRKTVFDDYGFQFFQFFTRLGGFCIIQCVR